MTKTFDYLVLGSGISGLSFALEAAEHGSVAVVTKREVAESNTRYAQGGIAAVVDPDDSFEAHVRDTLEAGAGLCHEDIVRLCVEAGPEVIRKLVERGVAFSRQHTPGADTGPYDLGREGGHRARRILHAGDITGAEIERALVDTARNHRNIAIYQHHVGINLITNGLLDPDLSTSQIRVLGAYVLDKVSGAVLTFLGRCTVIATGGVGKVYLYTSNPDVATGDGIAMAYRAGARIANMEFIQFHPTCLFHPKAKNFLISEALRGEGGELLTADGEPFMKRYHELGSLAPRDIVARAIDAELKRLGHDSVFLDMTHLSPDLIVERFPTIHATCLSYGVDMRREPIPVVPACHYSCGGVAVNAEGATSVGGLWAIGEVACTGLHGANRLASNSLLEGAVFAQRAAVDTRAAVEAARDEAFADIPPWDPGPARPSQEAVIVAHEWDELRRTMWNLVGIVRSNRRLLRARRRLDLILAEIREYYWEYTITSDLVELRNLATVARIIIESALRRHESRGLHTNVDYPNRRDKRIRDTIVDRLMIEGR